MLSKPDPSGSKPEQPAVVVKKYANRRLYNTETSTYVTLDDLAAMVRSDRDFIVYDAKTGDDLTHSVLTQIIVDQESKAGGHTLLPVPFLRQLIRFYDDSISRMVPTYLQFSMETLVSEQERLRTQFASAFSNPAAAFDAYHEQARKNMAMFEQAMAMWSPFAAAMQSNTPGSGEAGAPPQAQTARAEQPVPRPTEPKAQPQGRGKVASKAAESNSPNDELDLLKAQLAAMQAKIEKLTST